MIARSSLLLLLSLPSKNFHIAYYLNNINDVNTKLGMCVHLDKMQLHDKGHNSGVMPLFNYIF